VLYRWHAHTSWAATSRRRSLHSTAGAASTTRYRDEAQFRRGELMFALREYPKAEAAYLVTVRGDKGSPYYERALYMHGWSQFKQGRLEDSLQSFFGVRPEACRPWQ
jgi:TolA-binding protein